VDCIGGMCYNELLEWIVARKPGMHNRYAVELLKGEGGNMEAPLQEGKMLL
jgi:hypothetical protein